jgi:hypothetical protein
VVLDRYYDWWVQNYSFSLFQTFSNLCKIEISVTKNFTFDILYMKGLMMTVERQSKHLACIVIKIHYTVVVTVIHLLAIDPAHNRMPNTKFKLM